MKVLYFPLVRVTSFFVLGILLAYYKTPHPFFCITGLSCAFILLALCYWYGKKDLVQKNYFGITTFIVSFFIGMTTQIIHTDTLQKNHYFHQLSPLEKKHTLKITLNEKLKNTTLNSRYIAEVSQFDHQKSNGKIILNIRKDSLKNWNLEIGSIVKVEGFVYKNKEVNNPNQFDYGAYLEDKQIYAQIYSSINEIKISRNICKDIWYYTARFRNNIIHNLEKNHFSKKELSVVIALILGQQQDISPDVIQDYQYAGAVHVLSVSGLHVGFIMLFVSFILKPIPNTRLGTFSKLVIVLLSLWLFGFVAGLAPSILRSVTMFSFVAIGKYLQRSVNIYHTLLVSILIILLFEPAFLFDVGFQLSYISLFFIVWLQPKLASIWTPKHKAISYFWDILTVSFAAQIGAFPLSIYYFHQFPGLFFLTNLIILPFMGFILALGVIVMIMASINYVPYLPMKILEWSIFVLNKTINWVASFQDFVIQNIPMNIFLLWSLYLLIIAFILYFKTPSYKKLIIALATLVLFQISLLLIKYSYEKEKEWIVFNIKKSSLLTYRNGKNTSVFCNAKLSENSTILRVLNPYLVGHFSHKISTDSIPNLLYFQHKKILIMNQNPLYCAIKPDILVLINSPKLNLERFLEKNKPKIIIADNSNFKSYVKLWKATCEKQKIPFHDTAEKGFYRLE